MLFVHIYFTSCRRPRLLFIYSAPPSRDDSPGELTTPWAVYRSPLQFLCVRSKRLQRYYETEYESARKIVISVTDRLFIAPLLPSDATLATHDLTFRCKNCFLSLLVDCFLRRSINRRHAFSLRETPFVLLFILFFFCVSKVTLRDQLTW